MTLTFRTDDKPSAYGHHFIVGLSGPELSDIDKKILSRLRPAGVLLLKRNFDHTLSYRDWLAKLDRLLIAVREYSERKEIIVSLDHEGGKVHRAPPPITHFPSAMQYRERAAEVAQAHAIELLSLGVNLSWAPVCDIHSNPENPVIGERAFGLTASEAAKYSAIYAETLQSAGILGCAKHFPGHGDTLQDSHLELPVLNLNIEQLKAREFVPFKAVLDVGVPFVMTGHIKFPEIDKSAPATMSHKILHELLRGELGFNGVVIGDDLEMQAVIHDFAKADTIGKAMTAGCDMFIVSRFHQSDSLSVIDYGTSIGKCLFTKSLSEHRLHEAYSRIADLFSEKVKQHSPTVLAPEILEQHADLKLQLEDRA